jgi:HEAT repeat protein
MRLFPSQPFLKAAVVLFVSAALVFGQETADPKQRAKAVREIAKQGSDAIPQIAAYAADPDLNVRIEAVKALVEIGGPKTLDGLIKAAGDNDAEVQIRATEGIVNVYLPGYVKSGISGTLSRAGTSVKGKFTDTNDQVVDPFVQVSPDAITALGKLARGASSMDARATAARAVGVLRGQAAIPDLIEALHSKDNKLMFEALIAIQKIGDPTAAPRISFLLNDLEERIQAAALETTGLLHNKEAATSVRSALDRARSAKVRRAALGALAQLAEPADHARFVQGLADKDDGVRAAAAEGLGRLKNPADKSLLDPLFMNERGMNPRLAAAYGLVEQGQLDTSRYSPLRYLINTLNQRTWRGVASAYLIELAREAQIRQAIYTLLPESTKDEKIQLSMIFARSGEKDSVALLETLSKDPDPEVQAEGIRSLRTLRSRLP